ncbi:MAG: PA14 domain-containing protein, partial [Gammaproteobacteria bacterium]
GRLDDFRYYSYPLTAAEVKALYNSGSGTEDKNPSYYKEDLLSRGPVHAPGEKIEQLAYPRIPYLVSRIPYLVSRIPYLVADRPNEIRNTSDEIRTTKTSLSSFANWFERNVLGVGDAEATLPAAQGDGLKADYYDGMNFNAFAFTRVDPSVNFDWGSGSPNATLLGNDTYSIRWSGQIQPNYSEAYTFYTTTDDGVRLWINDVLLIDKWIDQAPKEWLGSISLVAGQKYNIKMEYYENAGGAVAKLEWASASQARGVVPPGNLSPWNSQDIGPVGIAGSTSYSSGTFTVQASGSDIWNTADGFRYVHQTLNGDGEIVARVDGVSNTHTWAKAGVMMRENLTAGSRHALMAVTPGNGSAFQRRLTTSGSSVSNSGGMVNAPYWVKLVRSGNTFKGYQSADGVTWVQAGPTETITMTQTIYVGLAVTSHNNSALNTSLLSNISVKVKPAAPVLNTATAGNAQVSLSWSAAAGATEYRIYYGTAAGVYGPGGDGPGAPITVGNVTTSTVTGLTNGTTYYFAVSAVNTGGESSKSNEVSAIPVASLSAPVLNTATMGNAQVSLSWAAATGAAGYKVKYGTISGGGAGTKDFTKDVDCVAAWKFSEATGTVTDSCKAIHGTVSGTLTRGVAGKYNSGIEFLGYPGGNNAVVNFGSDVSLDNLRARTLAAWIKPDNLGEGSKGTIFSKDYQDGWVLRLAANNNIAFSQAFSGGVMTWTTTTNALQLNVWQHVAVTYTGSGTTAVPVIYINGVAQAISGGIPFGTIDNDAALNLMFGIEATTQEFDGVIDEAAIFKRVLTPAEITGIMNNRIDGGIGMTYPSVIEAGNVTSYAVTGLTNGTTYYFVVSAKDASGESPNSNEKSAIPVAPPAAPVLNTAVVGDKQVTLTWAAATGATGYKVYYGTSTGVYGPQGPITVGNVTTSTVTGLTNGTTYYFALSAVNTGGES